MQRTERYLTLLEEIRDLIRRAHRLHSGLYRPPEEFSEWNQAQLVMIAKLLGSDLFKWKEELEGRAAYLRLKLERRKVHEDA